MKWETAISYYQPIASIHTLCHTIDASASPNSPNVQMCGSGACVPNRKLLCHFGTCRPVGTATDLVVPEPTIFRPLPLRNHFNSPVSPVGVFILPSFFNHGLFIIAQHSVIIPSLDSSRCIFNHIRVHRSGCILSFFSAQSPILLCDRPRRLLNTLHHNGGLFIVFGSASSRL